MITNFDHFNRLEKPILTLCNPNGNQLFALGQAYNVTLRAKFNALSELEFDYPETIDNNKTILPEYDFIKNKRLVLIENIGYFQITEKPEEYPGAARIKHVSCSSKEVELISKRVTTFSGTYQFYNPFNPSNSLMGKLLETYAPSWSIGTIDPILAVKFRTFDVSDTSLYALLMNDVEKAFGCIFSFDTLINSISASSVDSSIIPSDIYLSFDNLLKNGTMNEISEEITTCLHCYGADPLDIRTVNPLGTTAIYEFGHFKTPEWMSAELIAAIDAWQVKINEKQSVYASTLTSMKDENDHLIVLQSELEEFLAVYTSLEGVMKVRIEQGLEYEDIILQMINASKNINEKKIEITVSQNLIAEYQAVLKSINSYLKFVNKYTSNDYDDILARKTNAENELLILRNDLNRLKTEEFYLREDLKEAIANHQPADQLTTSLNNNLKEQKLLSRSQSSIAQEIVIIDEQLIDIDFDLKYPGNFTQKQYAELSNFIFENTYQNENIVQTDSMTNAEIQQQAQELYDQVKGVYDITTSSFLENGIIDRVAYPRYEFEVDAANFLALKEYEYFSSQLEVGTKIVVDLGDDVIIETVILEIEINYDNPNDFKLTFSNRLRLDNGRFRYTDLQEQTSKVVSKTNFNSNAWKDWQTNYKNDVTTFITGSLNAATNQIINSNNQEIVIGQNGLIGRTVIDPDAETLAYEDTQVWLTSSILAFTDDNWATSKLALGKITTPTGGTAFGLVGDVIVGRILAGNQLTISNDNNNFILNSQGAFLNNASFTISNGNRRIYLDPINGIKIQTNGTDKFFVDTNGNVNFAGILNGASGSFSGSITANSGLIGGFEINPSSLPQGIYTTNHNNYLRANGDMKWGNLTVTGGVFTFNGTINANQIVGQITNTQVGSGIYADKLDGGGMSFSRSGGGSINWAGGKLGVTETGAPIITGYGSLTLRGNSAEIGVGGGSNSIALNSPGGISINGSGWMDIYNSGINMRNHSIANISTITGGGSSSVSVDTVLASNLYVNYGSFHNGLPEYQTVYVGPGYSNKSLNFRWGLYTGYGQA